MTAFAQLKSVDDPRDKLDKATRFELAQFAKANNVTEIVPAMPAILMKQILRQKGLTNIQIPNRVLGLPRNAAPVESQQNVSATDAVADLARQWKEQQQPPAKLTMGEIRSALKKKGVKFSRTDKMEVLKAKLNGEQNAS